MPGFEKRKAGEWGVRDRNARALDKEGQAIPRVHEPALGITYGLVYDRECWMPEKHARTFLKDPSFIVVDANDVLVPTLTPTALLRVTPNELEPNVVLADVNELTDEALLTRCAQVPPQGTRFTSETAREILVRFLIDAHTVRKAVPARSTATDDADASDAEDMDEDGSDATRLLEGT